MNSIQADWRHYCAAAALLALLLGVLLTRLRTQPPISDSVPAGRGAVTEPDDPKAVSTVVPAH